MSSVSTLDFFQISSTNSLNFPFKPKYITTTANQPAVEVLLRNRSLKVFCLFRERLQVSCKYCMVFAWLFWIDEGNPSIMIWRVICVATCCRIVVCVRHTTIFFSKVNYISLIQYTISNLRGVTIDQAKLQKGTISFGISVRHSTCNESVSTERIFKKFDIWVLFVNTSMSGKIRFH
jgi:hypothetical protein